MLTPDQHADLRRFPPWVAEDATAIRYGVVGRVRLGVFGKDPHEAFYLGKNVGSHDRLDEAMGAVEAHHQRECEAFYHV